MPKPQPHRQNYSPPPSSHIASAPSFTINKVEKLVLLSGKQKFGQRCIEWITTARLLICMTAFPLRTIHLLNTQCWLCSLTVRQEWILERKIREGGGQDFIAQYINMSKFTCTDTFFFFFFAMFVLKAGACRSALGGQSNHVYGTVLGFHHITKGRKAGKQLR